MGKKGFFATLITILILLVLLFPPSTDEEFVLVPEELVDLENSAEMMGRSGDGRAVSFEMNDYFGYFSEDLQLSFLAEKDYRVAISDEIFINYPRIPKILDIQDSDGRGRAIIESSGYPFINGNHIIVMSDSFVSLYDLNGNLFWSKEILSIITSISINDDFVLIGYLDGLFELIGESGRVEFSFRPGGSRIEAIYSTAISKDSQYIAVISGLDPQRFILLHNRKSEFKPIYHFDLEKQFRRTVDMYFSDDSSLVFFEKNQGVNIFDIDDETLSEARFEGKLVKIYKDIDDEFFSLLMSGDSLGRFMLATPDNRIVLKKTIPGDSFFFRKRGHRYYIGADNKVMLLRLAEEK